MSIATLEPTIPGWAARAGLPQPTAGESFRAYVTRLGLDADSLLDGLEDRTAVLANYRLAHSLSRELPEAYHHYLDAYCSSRIAPERRKELKRIAENIWPNGRSNGR